MSFADWKARNTGDGVSMQTKAAYKRATGESFVPERGEPSEVVSVPTEKPSTQTVDPVRARQRLEEQRRSDQEIIKRKEQQKATQKKRTYYGD